MIINKLKAPRIYHLPWSQTLASDDKFITNNKMFDDKQVVITVKYDGESTSLYSDGTFHARSLDSRKHESRDWLYDWWSSRIYTTAYEDILNIYPQLRLVGENMYATHTIEYNNLKDLFILHSAWDGYKCLDWATTEHICRQLDIVYADVMYRGTYVESICRLYDDIDLYDNDQFEGYIVRSFTSYMYLDSNNNIAKFVSKNFKIDDTRDHWSREAIRRNKTIL